MKKFSAVLVFGLLISLNSHANLLSAGGCQFASWERDTDGFGDFSTGNDFEDDLSTCSVDLNVDYFGVVGDDTSVPISEAFFSNTLFRDISGLMASGTNYTLTIDYGVSTEFDGNPAPPFFADFFSIQFYNGFDFIGADGQLGFLSVPMEITQNITDSLSFELDGSVFSAFADLSLDIQLGLGADDFGFTDALGSTLSVFDVSLTAIDDGGDQSTDVSSPATFSLFVLSLLLMAAKVRRTFNSQI